MILKICLGAAAAAAVLLICLFSGGRAAYIASLALLAIAALPFFLRFERRGARARELALISLLAALAVAGRAAFFMLPQFKPSAAIVILAGVFLGRDAGALTGMLTALVSNFLFGQGPWTPWQMLAFGLIGFFAGIIFRGRRPSRPAICLYGGAAVLFLYGVIMDVSSALTLQRGYGGGVVIASLIAGFWFNLTHAAATVLFLRLLAKPMERKLARMHEKYGFFE